MGIKEQQTNWGRMPQRRLQVFTRMQRKGLHGYKMVTVWLQSAKMRPPKRPRAPRNYLILKEWCERGESNPYGCIVNY